MKFGLAAGLFTLLLLYLAFAGKSQKLDAEADPFDFPEPAKSSSGPWPSSIG